MLMLQGKILFNISCDDNSRYYKQHAEKVDQQKILPQKKKSP